MTSVQLTLMSEFDSYKASVEDVAYCVANLKAPAFESKTDKKVSIDIVAVIDKSGSMAGEKLELVKKTLETLIYQLRNEDRLALVTYDTGVYTDMPLTPMNSQGKGLASSAVRRIEVGSSTNLSGGLFKGIEILQKLSADDRHEVASVLLLTDGQANHGLTTSKDIIQAMQNLDGNHPQTTSSSSFGGRSIIGALKSLTSLSLSSKKEEHAVASEKDADTDTPTKSKSSIPTVYTFGYGLDANSTMLKEISDAAGGMYYFIDNQDTVSTCFGDVLGGLISTVAQNINLTLQTPENVTIKQVHTRSKHSISEKGHLVELSLPDLQSEEGRDIVLEIQLSKFKDADSKQAILSASLSYLSLLTLKTEESISHLAVLRPSALPSHIVANRDVDTQKNRVIAAAALETARSLGRSNLAGARKALQTAIDSIKASPTRSETYCTALISELEEALSNLKDQQTFNMMGEAYCSSRTQSHWNQRSNKAESNMYVTSAKSDMRGKFL